MGPAQNLQTSHDVYQIMLRLHGNLYVGRRQDGRVRLLEFWEVQPYAPKADGEYVATKVDVTIGTSDWPRVVTHVSLKPTDPGVYSMIKELHTGER